MGTKWPLEFDAIDPRNPDSLWKVGIPEWLIRHHRNNGNEKAMGRIWLLGDVLQGGTDELRGGWSRPGKDGDCFVYIGKPKRDFKSLKIETPAPQGMAFLVFVLSDGTIDEWTWRPLSGEGEEEGNPEGVKGELIWPLNKR